MPDQSQSAVPMRSETRTFSTMTRSLQVMRDWLLECGVTNAAMESTSTYWKGAFHNPAQAATAEGRFDVARDLLREGVVLSQETDDRANTACFLEALAVLEGQAGGNVRRVTGPAGSRTAGRDRRRHGWPAGAEGWRRSRPGPSPRGRGRRSSGSSLR
jgi:hypothetical protein